MTPQGSRAKGTVRPSSAGKGTTRTSSAAQFSANPQQAAAIAHTAGPAAFIAAAGTGKTSILVQRLVRLIADEKVFKRERKKK